MPVKKTMWEWGICVTRLSTHKWLWRIVMTSSLWVAAPRV